MSERTSCNSWPCSSPAAARPSCCCKCGCVGAPAAEGRWLLLLLPLLNAPASCASCMCSNSNACSAAMGVGAALLQDASRAASLGSRPASSWSEDSRCPQSSTGCAACGDRGAVALRGCFRAARCTAGCAAVLVVVGVAAAARFALPAGPPKSGLWASRGRLPYVAACWADEPGCAASGTGAAWWWCWPRRVANSCLQRCRYPQPGSMHSFKAINAGPHAPLGAVGMSPANCMPAC